MRKLRRSIAHAKMRKAGIEHINKPKYNNIGGFLIKCPSVFAENWRKYA